MAAHSITNLSIDEESREPLAGCIVDFYSLEPIQIQYHAIVLHTLQKSNQLGLYQHGQQAKSVEGHGDQARRERIVRFVILSCIMASDRLPTS